MGGRAARATSRARRPLAIERERLGRRLRDHQEHDRDRHHREHDPDGPSARRHAQVARAPHHEEPAQEQQAVRGIGEAIVEHLDRAEHVVLRRLWHLRRARAPDPVRRVEAHGDDREQDVNELRDRVFHAIPPKSSAATYVRPMIGTSAPFTPLDWRDDRNRMTAATSSGDGQVFGSTFGMRARFSGWSIVVGSIAFAVMPSPLTSAASASVQRATAPFDIAYAAELRAPLSAPSADTFTIRPYPRARIGTMQAAVAVTTVRTLVSHMSVMRPRSSADPPSNLPARFARTSSRPQTRRTCSTRPSIAARSAGSALTTSSLGSSALPAISASDARSACPFAASRTAIATCAPCARYERTTTGPRLPVAPVTTHT